VKKNRRLIFSALLLIPSAFLLLLELFPIEHFEDPVMNQMVQIILTRAMGSLVFIPLCIYMDYNVLGLTRTNRVKSLLCTLVPLAVVGNNFPIIGVISGEAFVTKPQWYIPIFALESLMIGLFEEFAFRGVLFPYILENRRNSSQSIFKATVISSAAFGAVHLFNLLMGGGIGGVLLQVGYSFLIGGMCAIVLLYTRCIWLCVALHAIYDFGGFMIPTLGTGVIWDPITVVITTILGVFALVFMLFWLKNITPAQVEEIYSKNRKRIG
jgi:membrane protease YdiL (CAAX protease family)